MSDGGPEVDTYVTTRELPAKEQRAVDERSDRILGRAALRDFILRGCVRDQRAGLCPIGEYPVWARRMMTEAVGQLHIALTVPR